jgi:hypothetical protein
MALDMALTDVVLSPEAATVAAFALLGAVALGARLDRRITDPVGLRNLLPTAVALAAMPLLHGWSGAHTAGSVVFACLAAVCGLAFAGFYGCYCW